MGEPVVGKAGSVGGRPIKMGLWVSRESPKGEVEIGEVPIGTPPDGPLGRKLAWQKYYPNTRDKGKLKTVQYCIVEWTRKEIRNNHVYWLRYGSEEGWLC